MFCVSRRGWGWKRFLAEANEGEGLKFPAWLLPWMRFGVPVLAYGLKNDFRNELFEGSYYMLVYADKIEEIKTICWCGRKATMVARVVDGKFVKQGEQIVVGGNDMYVSLCRKHYNDGRLGPDTE